MSSRISIRNGDNDRGLLYMTSAVGGGGGSSKSRQKEQHQLIYVCDKGGKKIRTSYMEAPIAILPLSRSRSPLSSFRSFKCWIGSNFIYRVHTVSHFHFQTVQKSIEDHHKTQKIVAVICIKSLYSLVRQLVDKICYMFSESFSCLLGQHGRCSSAQQPVELSENILQNLFYKLPTQSV